MLLKRGGQPTACCRRGSPRLDGFTLCGQAPSGASPSPINRTNSQISTLQTHAQALAEQITTDQNKVSVDAEAYDEYTVLVQQDQLKLAKIERQLKATRSQLARCGPRPRTRPIEAYVTGDGFDSPGGRDTQLERQRRPERGRLLRRRRPLIEGSRRPSCTSSQVQLAGERATQARTTAAAAAVPAVRGQGKRPRRGGDGQRRGGPEPGQGPALHAHV